MLKLCNVLILTMCCSLFCGANVYANATVKTLNQNDTTLTSSNKSKAKNTIAEKVNINKADAKTLEKVKFIGPKKAQAIVDYRNTNGEFKSIDDLLNVKARGMNKKWLEKVSNNLNL